MSTALSDIRKLKHMTQEELPAKSGISTHMIWKYEKDVKNLRKASYEKVEYLAKALGVSVDDIFLTDTSVFLKRIEHKDLVN